MINKALMGFMIASHAVGKPIVKGIKFATKNTPKSVKKFGKKSNKFIKKEIKGLKTYAKETPEMFAGSVAIGAGLGLGIRSFRKDKNNNKKRKV